MNILTILGKIDGGIAAVAALWGTQNPKYTTIALAIAGIAGGLGVVLNALSHALGGGDVASVEPKK